METKINVSPDKVGFEAQAKVLYATAMANTLNFILKRDYLNRISLSAANVREQELCFKYLPKQDCKEDPIWLKIEQVGLPVKDTLRICFDALQRILLFCAHQNQVLFLVSYAHDQYHMFLGLRPLPNNEGVIGKNSFVSFLKDFSQSLWNGLSCSQVGNNTDSCSLINELISKKVEKVVAITGIPTNDINQNDAYPLTIDNLLKSVRGKGVTYLVCADPVNQEEINQALFEFREVQGQMESIKTMSLQHSEAFSTTHTDCLNWSISHSSRDFKKLKDDVFSFLGKGGYKPAIALMKALPLSGDFLAGTTVGAVGAAAVAGVATAGATGVAGGTLMSGIALAGLLSGVFVGSKTEQNGGSESVSEGVSSTSTLGQSIVNKHAESVAKQLEIYSERYEVGRATGMWNVGVYLFGEGKDVDNAAYQLMSLCSGKASTYEPIRRHDISFILNEGKIDLTSIPDIYVSTESNKIFDNPFGKHNSEIRTILTTRELTAFINLPLRSVDGINVVDTTPDFSLRPPKVMGTDSELRIGKLLNGGMVTGMDCTMDLRTLCKHSLVCGINGSGKTNTVLNILTEVKRQGKPFLIIEPAKTEYVDWAFRYNQHKSPQEQIRILMPGKKKYAAPIGESGNRVQTDITEQLRMNPFEVLDLGYGDPEDHRNKTISHIDLVKTMFGLAFPMQDILPTVLELLIYHLYDTAEKNNRVLFPTFSSMLMTCEGDFIQNLGYDAKNTMIIRGALKTRVNSLLHGWKKELLNNPVMKGMTWQEFFAKPTVLNLSAVGDDSDKAFIMGLILMFLFEYWQSKAEDPEFSFSENKLNHLLVIEEAHRIMTANTNMDSPMYKVGRFFTNFLTEMRAYGQGLMIVDQVPGRLIPDAISNTNLKIVHKLVAGNDIDALSVSMGLSTEQKQMISRLATGQSIISGLNSLHVGTTSEDDVYWCLMNKMK